MMKTPLWGNALLILNVHLEHDTPASNSFAKGGDAR
jgi:hypothetical protein